MANQRSQHVSLYLLLCSAGEVLDLQYYQPMDPKQGVAPVLRIHSVMQVNIPKPCSKEAPSLTL